MASAPYWTTTSSGVSALPLDLDIFLRSGSRIQPLMAACFHGIELCWRWARTTVEKSQVRMMSWPWGRTSIGKMVSKSSVHRALRHHLPDGRAPPGPGHHPNLALLDGRARPPPAQLDPVEARGHQPVSYTHLRAHETDSYLVCRLLLEKKKKINQEQT